MRWAKERVPQNDRHKTLQPLPFRSRAMKICVIGCGAVGSLFAAHLARAGKVEVFAYDVSQPHVDAINARGLRLSGAAEFTARLRASGDSKEMPRCDYGIVATNATHNKDAITHTAHVFDEHNEVRSGQYRGGYEKLIDEPLRRVIS